MSRLAILRGPIFKGRLIKSANSELMDPLKNKSRGMRLKADTDDTISALVESQLSSKAWRKNLAWLIQKKLSHLELWDTRLVG